MQILFRKNDKTNVNPSKDFWNLKAGEVVVVVDDEHKWTYKEFTNPNWRIVKAINLPPSDAYTFVEKKLDGEGNVLANRRYILDLSFPTITEAFQTWWLDDTRSSPVYVTNWPSMDLLALRKEKP